MHTKTIVKVSREGHPPYRSHKSFFTTELLCIFLAQTLHHFSKSSPSKCKCPDFPLNVSFSSKFKSLFSVMRHNSSVLFHLKLYLLWTKRSPSKWKFWDFELLTWKLNKYLLITLQCHDIICWNICFGQKSFFRVLSALSHQFLIPQGHGLFKFCITVQCHERYITPLYFFSNLIYFEQKESVKGKYSDFWVVGWKFTKFLMPYLKPKVSLSLMALFSIITDNSSVLFQLKPYIIWTKWGHQSEKFLTFVCSQEISPNLYFDRLLLLKVYKKVQRGLSQDTEEWCRIWRKADLFFHKWQQFSEFWLEHSKSQKFAFWLVPFVQSISCLT